ncbi:TetR/AcrR family transcriptional regulator [Acidicapsa dinghuensis]|uniref:TetR/AcrR family transcriptional regulator n=1 Tax=Acidicapsa dinghuensis TaxID=2218256 RepID=A0ABW1EKT8_9BACT|nr:helix-turn-helix domain-containing protein [Acidicapsa dinghuensis]
MATSKIEEPRRPYELGKRLEQMDKSRADILRAARLQLEANGFRQFTMSSLAAECGLTRQTVHNLFGTKTALLEALFDVIALDSGMERMREAMMQPSPQAMLEQLIHVFCGFWARNRVLFRRIHGIGAIDPEFGAVIAARNQRRTLIATRIVSRWQGSGDSNTQSNTRIASLAALTSFEFFDALVESTLTETQAEAVILELARKVLT